VEPFERNLMRLREPRHGAVRISSEKSQISNLKIQISKFKSQIPRNLELRMREKKMGEKNIPFYHLSF
jgi:hypothetical protein